MPDEHVTKPLEDWQTCDVLDDGHRGSVIYPLGHVTIFGNFEHKAYEVHHPHHGLLPNSRFQTLVDAVNYARDYRKK